MLLAFSAALGGPKLNRHRSFYVPVRFDACPHVRNVTLSVVGENAVFPLGERKFLFSYDPDHEKVLPEVVEVRIKGHGLCNDTEFETNLMVTLEGAFGAEDSMEADAEWFKKQLRIHRDVRFPVRAVFITCSADCETKGATLSQPKSAPGEGAAGEPTPSGGGTRSAEREARPPAPNRTSQSDWEPVR